MLLSSRKFHMRTYVIIVEDDGPSDDSPVQWDAYVYNRHEVRIAEMQIDHMAENASNVRDRRAHITNGASEGKTGRYVLEEVQELVELDMGQKLVSFVHSIIQSISSDISRRINDDKRSRGIDENPTNLRRMAFAGIDVMCDTNGRLYLLEVNVNPAAPPQMFVSKLFKTHLCQLCRDFVELLFREAKYDSNEAVGGWLPLTLLLE